ncbi:YheU family protein [Pseudobacteriovorax antillogorgiicola]|uniref:YheU family protein n=1 Tax=Pseudobacteriovorax antillogorgiicola TaxID=1513793 RepID=A0A1Y6BZI6_9BACT|nr:YheU family protein [Pseudobacteriovorax antillogorgiicola]TCS52416.1 hypothetical protein EDD56_109161 [Pseudobacteriovorax antillogorgiicola]SMF28809.1 hypothetical protein SAMN06296036_10952 [Pseudobacteriovorax antillogorgiicola]
MDSIEIPVERMDRDTLNRVIEEFVSREGTDYGEIDYTLQEKVTQVRQQLESGLAVLIFDRETSTCNILPKN